LKNTTRQPWIGGNWKMFKTIPEVRSFIQDLRPVLPGSLKVDTVIAPPFTALEVLGREIKNTPIKLAAQNVHWAPEGAFTGEVSCAMLRDVSCTYCILGHSERRQLFGETDEMIRKKFQACLKAGLKPVLCVGETLEEREAGRIQQVITRQLLEAVQEFSPEEIAEGVIAYEPVWAIGTGKTATPAMAQEVHALIRSLLETQFNKTLAMGKRIVYGGSVTPENIGALYAEPDIDGALVGGASLNPDKFMALIKEVNQ
jgi:triosephosphate isomerase (TIM)